MSDERGRTRRGRIDRRSYLAAVAGGIALAGCSGGGDGEDGDDGDADGDDGASGNGGDEGTATPTETETETETDSPTPEPSLAQEWGAALGEFRVTGNTFSGAYAGDRLFVSARDQGVYALDAASGEQLGEAEVSGLSAAGLVGGESRVYRVHQDGQEARVTAYATPGGGE